MATIVLGAAGAAMGGSLGGTLLGVSAVALGRAAGAALGRGIDERLLGAGSAPVETGRIDRFRLTGSGEGAPVARVFGRMRIGGQVIWASRFEERSQTTGGGKGAPSQPGVTTYDYHVSLAIGLCAGEITRVGRVWADGEEVPATDLTMRVYRGTPEQRPDPKIEAVEGSGRVPAFRGLAYVVLEDLALARFGNRVPQLSFEVFRPAEERSDADAEDLAHLVKGVAMIPGSGEYVLATSPVFVSEGFGRRTSVNLNSPSGQSDFLTSLDALDEELPNCRSVSLVVSWFGDDLRCGTCTIRPKVEQRDVDAVDMPWRVGPVSRHGAMTVPRVGDRPVYGGTPTDASVAEAIAALRAAGKSVVYYPFILMDQIAGNGLPDPHSGASDQPALPWRGRITLDIAPGREGSADRTAAADAQVAAFFGTAGTGDFPRRAGRRDYDGPDEWSYRRFVLHQAHLCADAGGVDAFCIGSEMVALTTIRGAGDRFPVVAALRALAADVRTILGPDCTITYAADWTEYHGLQTGGGDKRFHLDPLWADENIDVIGIDNYMPISDWRDSMDHADAGAGSIYALDYLSANVAGGELFDWYYASPEARAAQHRTPITDGAHDEPWVYRTKDLVGWWDNHHHDRIDGVRAETPTPWVPRSKPIWFTEFGCAAIDKGTNEPNKFLDPKSSESTLPYASNGLRDDYIQMQYIRAVHRHFADPQANPVSDVYGGPMVDMGRAHVWCWDTRPFPEFPANEALWSDGANYARGHWLNGRTTVRSLTSVVREICNRSDVDALDLTRLHGLVRGYRTDDTDTARAALQTLMLAYGFDAIERDGVLAFRSRDGRADAVVDPARFVLDPEQAATFERTRAAEPEIAGRVRVDYIESGGDYGLRAVEAAFPGDAATTVTQSELPLALTRGEARGLSERWLAEARVARDTARFALPPSRGDLGAGDVVWIEDEGADALYRIDCAEVTEFQSLETVRVTPEIYGPHGAEEEARGTSTYVPPNPIDAVFLDLPLLTGDEVPHAPHVAMTAARWPGAAALYSAPQDAGYRLDRLVPRAAIVGTTLTAMSAAQPGLWDRGPALRIELVRGALQSMEMADILSGRNVMAIGDGSPDIWEVFQFVEAELVAPRIYDLRLRLRGQAGTDGVMPPEWPAGSRVVLLDKAPVQVDLAPTARDVARHYRYGPARRPLGDPTFGYRTASFRGVGLRPYPVAHLRADERPDGALALSWTRRTRIDGDGWDAAEVPLGEARERYLVRVSVDGVERRAVEVGDAGWTYTADARAADGLAGVTRIEVAQVSDRFGPGPARPLVLGQDAA